MYKSNILYNKEDYVKWMFDSKYWTNPNYKPHDWDLPSLDVFPCIATGTWITDYRTGRNIPEIELVSLKDFSSVPLHVISQRRDVVGIFDNLGEALTELNYTEDYYDGKYVIEEFKLNELKNAG